MDCALSEHQQEVQRRAQAFAASEVAPVALALDREGHIPPGIIERLVVAAKATDPLVHMLVLLAAEAGLRSGEMVALEWNDIDFGKGQMCVRRSSWKGQVASPKGGRLRYVPLTRRLAAASTSSRATRAVSG